MIRRACLLVLALLLGAVTIPLVGSADRAGATFMAAGAVRKSFQPNNGKIFVLVIGTDARSGNPTNVRADAIHLVGVNTRTMRGGVLNFPRDSYVNIPRSGSGRINEALTRGGPRLLVETVERLTGIRVNYWVMTGFEGFRNIIREVGRVRMTFRKGLRDPGGSGVNIAPGTKWLYPESALAFVRTRKALPGGDLARTTNQARFLLALLRKLRMKTATNPGTLFHWISVAQQHTKLNLSTSELFRLGILATQMEPTRVGNVTVPARAGSAGGASVVFIGGGARSIYRRFNRTGAL